jgi:ATP-dependent RNA helicase DDX47/RRP3
MQKNTPKDDYFDESVTFESLDIHPLILKELKKLNYKYPTKIQRETFPYSLKDKDIIGLAETGSGKTLSFVLPMVQSLLTNKRSFYGLILSPTRELCLQIQEHINALASGLGITSCVIVGGLDLMAQAVALVNKKPNIIVATPGRMLHHLENTKGFSLDKLGTLVLDEADKLLSMNFEDALDKILSCLPKKRRTFLFSATMTNKVNKLQRASLRNPVKVEVSSSKHQTVSTLTQNYIFLPHKFKEAYLTELINVNMGKSCIVFVSTCKGVIRTVLFLRNLGFDCVPIHGQMTQVKRINALSKFKSNQKSILVATDVASRGLDIPSVDLVINFDIPANSKDYVHRVGRTARAGRAGLAISMVTQYEVEQFQKIEHSIKKTMDKYELSESQVLKINARVQEALKIADFELKTLLSKKKKGKRARLELQDNKKGKKRFKKTKVK